MPAGRLGGAGESERKRAGDRRGEDEGGEHRGRLLRPPPRRRLLLPGRLREADREEVEVRRGEQDPRAERRPDRVGGRSSPREERDEERGAKEADLRPEQGEVDDRAARERSGEEELRLALGEGEGRRPLPEDPGEARGDQESGGGEERRDEEELGRDALRPRREAAPPSGPEEEEAEVGERHGQPDEIAGLLKALHAPPDAVGERPRREEGERPERGGSRAQAPVSVTRRKTSSSDASLPPAARISSSVPARTARPFDRMRTRSQISSTSGRR